MTSLAEITSRYLTGHDYKARAEAIPAVPARYSQMIHLAAQAADAYREAATLASLPTERLPEVTALRRTVAAWLDQLSDPHIIAAAIVAGFPAHLAPMVSIKALHGWLTAPIYQGGYEHPNFARILTKAAEEYADAYPDLMPCEMCGAEAGEDCDPYLYCRSSQEIEPPAPATVVETATAPVFSDRPAIESGPRRDAITAVPILTEFLAALTR
ncbi:hypothetical protein ACWCSD_42325 [Nonomuraea sp. NPDC001684]